jgi:hypothetical protein
MHTPLVLGRLAEVPAFLRDHVFLADLECSEGLALSFGETLVFQWASGAVGLCPSENPDLKGPPSEPPECGTGLQPGLPAVLGLAGFYLHLSRHP